MGKHDQHLPRRDLNKAAQARDPRNGQVASVRTLGRVARAQGQGTKDDAKAAKAKGRART